MTHTTPPTVTNTAPTSGATYGTRTSPMTLGVTASDNIGVTQVTWANSLGDGGTATGTSGVSLSPGLCQ